MGMVPNRANDPGGAGCRPDLRVLLYHWNNSRSSGIQNNFRHGVVCVTLRSDFQDPNCELDVQNSVCVSGLGVYDSSLGHWNIGVETAR